MKKVVILICALFAIMTVSINVIAEVPDISGLSDDELIMLKTEILNQQIERGTIKEIDIPGGRYTVGVDIPAGNYTISFIDRGTNLTVWGSEYQDFKSNGGLLLNTTVNKNNPSLGKVVLVEGNVIDFDAALKFSRFVGFDF